MPYALSDLLQGRTPNSLMGDTPMSPVPPRRQAVGKGSVQQEAPPALGQHNLLARMLQGAAEGVTDSYNAMGRLPRNWDEAAQQFLTVMPGGGLTGIFAGRRAVTANLPALRRAEEMAAAGRPREAIWNETGWFQGRDGQWRFEIDDSAMSVGRGNQTGIRGEALSHPDLAAAYPALDDLPVSVNLDLPGDRSSFYQPRSSSVGPELRVRGYPEYHRAGSVHELQHAVDDLENRLGSPRYASPAEAYQSIEEVMARNAQHRATLSSEQRRARPPWTTQGIPDERQIVRLR